MSGFLLDTSALLSHYRGEPGWERAQRALETDGVEILILAVSIAEMARALAEMGADDKTARATALDYADLASSILEVDAAVAVRAFEIGTATEARLPLVDALIAAGAERSGATLLHRDRRFNAIPAGLLKQEFIG